MSHHRQRVHIFIDQSSFSEKIDWKKVKTLRTSIEKPQAVSRAVFDEAAKAMNQPKVWFGMLFVFSVYEPASTLLYGITMQFTGSSQVLASMEALKSDPLILSGAPSSTTT